MIGDGTNSSLSTAECSAELSRHLRSRRVKVEVLNNKWKLAKKKKEMAFKISECYKIINAY